MKDPKIIGLLGKAGSGKNTVADIIADLLGPANTAQIAFAGPLKAFCREVGWGDEHVDGRLKEIPDTAWAREGRPPLSPREAMQQLGTEWGRSCHPEVWVRLGIRRCVEAGANGKTAIVTDVRFLNEARAVRAAGGHILRLTRPTTAALPHRAHASEMEQTSKDMQFYVSRTINNVGSLTDLRDDVAAQLRDIMGEPT